MSANEVVDPRAILPAPGPTISKFKKVLFYVKREVVKGVGYLLYESGLEVNSTGGDPETEPATEWRLFQFVAEHMTSAERADDEVFTLNVMNFTNSNVDNSWTQGDYDYIQPSLEAFTAALAALMSSNYKFTSCRVYRRSFTPLPDPSAPIADDKPFPDAGPPLHIYTLNNVGGFSSGVAPQGTSSVTLEVPERKHWGRFYVPTLGALAYNTSGRVATSAVDAFAGAMDTFDTALIAGGFHPIVVHTRNMGAAERAWSTISGIHVDDVPDVIRRRRPASVIYRKRFPVTP